VTEHDIQCLHEIWPEEDYNVGLSVRLAPDSTLLKLAAHPWDSVTLRGMILGELHSRISKHERSTT
jgi:hypothetical protein